MSEEKKEQAKQIMETFDGMSKENQEKALIYMQGLADAERK